MDTDTTGQPKPVWELNEAELASGRLITAKCQNCNGTGRRTRQYFNASCEDACECIYRAGHCLDQAEFPHRFGDKTLADLDWACLVPHDLADGVREYAEKLNVFWQAGIGLVLFGRVGNGKTHTAIGIGKIACGWGYSVAFVTLADLLDELRAGFDRDWPEARTSRRGGSAGPDGEGNRLSELADSDWLILDDLGLESNTAWAREKVYQLINRRWLDQLPTIVTTNRSPDELAARFGEGVVSRLWGESMVLHFQGADYRLRLKADKLARVRGNGPD